MKKKSSRSVFIPIEVGSTDSLGTDPLSAGNDTLERQKAINFSAMSEAVAAYRKCGTVPQKPLNLTRKDMKK